MGLRQRGVGANRMGVEKDGREDGRGERNRQTYRAECKNQFKTREARRNGCELDRDEDGIPSVDVHR